MKRFNVTGTCLPDKHYMCDVSAKFARCKELIEDGDYYAINFPRQHGKTTMKALLGKEFRKYDDYLVISTSFEGIGDTPFESEKSLAQSFLLVMAKSFRFHNKELAQILKASSEKIHSFDELSEFLSEWIASLNKKVVLLIDEVDKASNNQVFISLLAMLRDKYLEAKEEMDITFHSVVLIGVHDIKSLKLKLRPEEEKKLNSPWNIAVDLDIDFTFSAKEIEKMIVDYAKEHSFNMNSSEIAKLLFFYTSGNPFLVSKFCQLIDEKFAGLKNIAWTVSNIADAYKYLIDGNYTTTNFDDVDKNLENNEDLFNLVEDIVINGGNHRFNISNPVISKGKTYGILSQNSTGQCDVSNKVYEFRIMDYMLSKQQTRENQLNLYATTKFKENDELNISLILEKFQLFMKEHNSSKDNSFLEKNGRMLLMSFFRPIINGKGFMFKENVTSEDRKMDLVITYNDKRYVIELKIWYGEKYLSDGIEQLCEYLDSYNLDEGHILIYNFNKNKKYEIKQVENCRKDITAVFV
ncbi:MAG: AAA family ATPase [Verrucomicrobiota bacterium]|nr:AAA family ATPase [Verrucomicrobiota bacterium]